MKFKQKQREEQAEPDGTEGTTPCGYFSINRIDIISSSKAWTMILLSLTYWMKGNGIKGKKWHAHSLPGVLHDWADLWRYDFCPFHSSLAYCKLVFAMWLKLFLFQWINCVPTCTVGKKTTKKNRSEFSYHYLSRLEFLISFLSVVHFSCVSNITQNINSPSLKLSFFKKWLELAMLLKQY